MKFTRGKLHDLPSPAKKDENSSGALHCIALPDAISSFDASATGCGRFGAAVSERSEAVLLYDGPDLVVADGHTFRSQCSRYELLSEVATCK